MSYPILYSSTATSFDNNGLGILSGCISCEVTEEANGIYELSMKYPTSGVHYLDIGNRSIIKAKANQFVEPQLFRVYSISRPMFDAVTVLARHISYDLSGIPVSPFSASRVDTAILGLKTNAVIDCTFEFWTDKNVDSNFKVTTPASIRSCLGGSSGSILDVYGGEFEFDNFLVKLYKNRGKNRGVSIRYGKNLTNINQEENCASVATGIYPYWLGVGSDGEEVMVSLPEKIVNAPGTYDFVRIKTVDFSADFEEKPSEEQLRNKAVSYVSNNNIGVPGVSIKVSFEQLGKTEEYRNLMSLEKVSLFDVVSVEFPALNVSNTAKVVKVVYDSISESIKTVEIGSVRSTIADTMANIPDGGTIPTKSDVSSAVLNAQRLANTWLTNGEGYAYFRKDNDGNIKDILFLDEKNIEAAINIMRVGQSGIGFSHSGVDGPYESAWTIDGRFNADFIAAGTLDADVVKVINFVAEKIKSIKTTEENGEVGRGVKIIDGEIVFIEKNGEDETIVGRIMPISTFVDATAAGVFRLFGEEGTSIGSVGSQTNIYGTSVIFDADAEVSIGGKKAFWRDNGDGTFVLAGE